MTSATPSIAKSDSRFVPGWRPVWWNSSAPLFFVRMALVREGAFLSVTLAACAVAAAVATFQFAVFASFMRTGAVMPRSIGADFWVTGSTVECFDFPDPIAEDYDAALIRYLPPASFRRVVFGFVPWRSPDGRRGNVAVVGVDGDDLPADGFAVDRSDLDRLDLTDGAGQPALQAEATLGGRTLRMARVRDDMATFLGAPYVRVPLETGRELLRMDPGSVSFLAGNFRSGEASEVSQAERQATRAFPDIALISDARFAASSANYWLRKTGAGMAILLAAVLAAILMTILLVNGIARFMQRFEQDLLSLLGHGASDREISIIVTLVAGAIGVGTAAIVLTLAPLSIWLSRPFLPWVEFRWVDMVAPMLVVLVAVTIAILSARRAISTFDPAAVFRN